jgi:hypothetical protein
MQESERRCHHGILDDLPAPVTAAVYPDEIGVSILQDSHERFESKLDPYALRAIIGRRRREPSIHADEGVLRIRPPGMLIVGHGPVQSRLQLAVVRGFSRSRRECLDQV